MSRVLLVSLTVALLLGALAINDTGQYATASPGAITFREPSLGLPHIYADTDLELARENGREIAKDRLGQMALIGRVARGTLYQAFGVLDASTFNDDLEVRRDGYTSSELNNMFDKLPSDIQALLLEYCKGVNDTIDAIYAGSLPLPAEVYLLQLLGLGSDLFGNATNVSDQIDPYYLAPGGADPDHPDGGFQFTPELVMSIAVLQVRNFGTNSFGETSRLNELNTLLSKFAMDGDEIWNDLNFMNDPLAPVTVPDASTPGFGGPLAGHEIAQPDEAQTVSAFPNYDYSAADEALRQERAHREEFATALGAWPKLGSYAWMIDGERSATSNPWVGGFPQTGTQTPSIMHFVEMRSAEGSDHQIEAMGMEFVGAPAVLIGQTDSVGWTSTTAQLKTDDIYFEQLVLEDTDALRYDDEGTLAAMTMRTEQIKNTAGVGTPVVLWRTHERAGNGGARTVEAFQGDRTGTTDSATATSLTDAGAFSGSYAGGYVALTDGVGAGQMRPILSNTADTLTLAGGDAWTTTPNSTSKYVAVLSGNNMLATARDRSYWLEESTTALGFAIFNRAESILDIRRGTRLMPSTHNFISADNQAFDGIGSNLGPGTGNTGYYSSGFSRVRQGATDPRLPLDGTQPDELVVASGSVGSSGANTLTDTGGFTGDDFSPPVYNYRLNNPSTQGSEYIVTIIGGDGYRQTRRIAGNTDDTLTLEEDWGVQPSAGDLYEIYEIVAMPEAINPPNGYTANWNNKAATADIGRDFGRQHRAIFILERLAGNSSWSRDDQRQLNKDVAGLDGKGDFGRYLIPRVRQAVNGVGNGGNPQVDTVLAQLETFQAGPQHGRGFIDPVSAVEIAGETQFLESLISHLSTAIYGDEFSGTSVSAPGGTRGLNLVQHAIDSAAGVPDTYAQAYTGDYFNGSDWRVVVRDAFAQTITDLGGMPGDIDRYDTTFVHPLQPVFTNLVFDPTPVGNRGAWEQIVEVGSTVNGEFIFPLGQSGFIDNAGNPDPNFTTLHRFWRDWRFMPMLHVAEDLAADPDGDLDNDGVLDGFEKWYFGTTDLSATSDTDGDTLDLHEEYENLTDPTNEDTDGDGCRDGFEVGGNEELGGQRDPNYIWDFYDVDRNGEIDLFIDIFGVASAFGAVPGDPAYDAGLDRSAPESGADPWVMGPPDGTIDLFIDIFGVASQFGRSCG